MHARITTVIGATAVDTGLALLRHEVLPQMQEQHGFGGLSAAGDRSSRVVTVLSFWDSEADLEASESASSKAGGALAQVMGGEFSVEHFEQTVWAVGDGRPGPGAKLHIRRVQIAPARIDENLEFFRQTVLPEMKARPGFLALRHLIDRSTGQARVGSVWVNHESLSASLARSESRRATARDRGIEFGEDQVLEVLLTAM